MIAVAAPLEKLQDRDGRIALPFIFTGSFLNPDISLDKQNISNQLNPNQADGAIRKMIIKCNDVAWLFRLTRKIIYMR